MPISFRASLTLLATLVFPLPAVAALYTVGHTTDCSHSQLSTALAAAVADAGSGPHQIRLAVLEQAVDNLLLVNPVRDIEITGGFTACGNATPTATFPTTLRATPGNTRVMQIQNAVGNPRRAVTLRNVAIRDGNLATGEGGGLHITGPMTVNLERGTVVEENSASNGGGIHLSSTGPTLDQYAQLNMAYGAIVRNNRADTLVAQGYGGGIHCLRGCTVHAWHGEISGNFAFRSGGGVALRSGSASMLIDPSPGAGQQVFIVGNAAGHASSGQASYGGGIFINEGSLSARIFGDDPTADYSVRITGNIADMGGAIGAIGPTALPYRNISLDGPLVAGNSARERGGALYALNGVVWHIDHSRIGDCIVAGTVRKPCSYFFGNSRTGPSSGAGGAVGYFTNDAGALAGIANISRTLFENNSDDHGVSAVFEVLQDQRLNIRRSVFTGNIAGGSGGERTLIGGTGSNVDFFYNSVLHNQVGGVFYMHGGVLRPQGSVFWAPGRELIYAYAGAAVALPAVAPCIVTHSTAGLPAATYWQVDPALDARFAPRGRSPALDHCTGASDAGNDLYGRAPQHDVASVPDRLGSIDLGAVEQRDIVLYSGFGNRPGN